MSIILANIHIHIPYTRFNYVLLSTLNYSINKHIDIKRLQLNRSKPREFQ